MDEEKPKKKWMEKNEICNLLLEEKNLTPINELQISKYTFSQVFLKLCFSDNL